MRAWTSTNRPLPHENAVHRLHNSTDREREALEWLESTTWSEEGTMPEATDPASVVNQLGQQGKEMLEKSQTMVADLLRGYLGQFQVGCCCCMDTHKAKSWESCDGLLIHKHPPDRNFCIMLCIMLVTATIDERCWICSNQGGLSDHAWHSLDH